MIRLNLLYLSRLNIYFQQPCLMMFAQYCSRCNYDVEHKRRRAMHEKWKFLNVSLLDPVRTLFQGQMSEPMTLSCWLIVVSVLINKNSNFIFSPSWLARLSLNNRKSSNGVCVYSCSAQGFFSFLAFIFRKLKSERLFFLSKAKTEKKTFLSVEEKKKKVFKFTWLSSRLVKQ